MPLLVDETGDTITGDLAFAGSAGLRFAGGRLTGDPRLAYDGWHVCLADLATPGCGDIEAVAAGSGLSGGATSGTATLSVNTGVIQSRVSGACAAGSSIRAIDGAGGVTCETVDTSALWRVTGNAGTRPATDFLGTTDDVAFEVRVNNARALRIEPGTSPNLLAGHASNGLGSTVIGATISGGGASGKPNTVLREFGTIAGGENNTAGNAFSQSDHAFVGGGSDNRAAGSYSVVAGGTRNVAGYDTSSIGGGYGNRAEGQGSAIGGGWYNTAAHPGHGITFATIAGGNANTIAANYSAIGGGAGNTVSGFASTVAGGFYNTAAGESGFAAGRRAKAMHDGSFVWADHTNPDGDLASTGSGQFLARASGGVTFYTDSGATVGATLAPGSGSWSSVSDRNLKERVEEVDVREVLAKVAAMPVAKWSYTTQPGVRHLGPMAQDFAAAFGLGEDGRHISGVDADGVALAAIQGLWVELEEERARNDALEARLAALEAALAAP